jgi:hypothetical protein
MSVAFPDEFGIDGIRSYKDGQILSTFFRNRELRPKRDPTYALALANPIPGERQRSRRQRRYGKCLSGKWGCFAARNMGQKNPVASALLTSAMGIAQRADRRYFAPAFDFASNSAISFLKSSRPRSGSRADSIRNESGLL